MEIRRRPASTPMPEECDRERLIARSWRVNARAWSDAVREGRIASRRAGTDAAIVAAVLRTQPANVLDLGCGEGWLVRALRSHGIDASGVDASPELVALARAAGGADFACASYRDLARRAPERRFDVVACNFALFGEDLRDPLQAAHARLRPDGWLLVQTLHPRLTGGEHTDAGWRMEDFQGMAGAFREPMPWYHRTTRAWHDALVAAGFTPEQAEEPRDAEGNVLSLLLRARRRAGGRAPD